MASPNTDISKLETSARFMARKLTQARKMIGDQGVVIEYDNGGGQCGIRENPAITGYIKLNAEYKATVKLIAELREKEPKRQEGKSTLATLRVVGKRETG